MERIDRTASRALRSLIDDQPVSRGKVAFAWSIAAGPTLAAATSVSWHDDGTVYVRAKSDEWRRELHRAKPMLLERIAQVLGAGVVRSIKVLTLPPEP